MLPQTLKYTGKVESAPAQSYRTNIQPQNGTGPYTSSNTIILNIPTANNLVLCPTESYLKFKLTLNNTSTFRFDSCGAHGLIQRLRIFHGSNLLQDIDNYGLLLAKMLFALQVPDDANKGKYNILNGNRADINTTSGTTIFSGDGGLTTSFTNRYFALNLVSILGTLCSSQYLPLFAMTSAPLRMELQLVASANQALCDLSGNITYQMDQVEYVGNFIKLSDSAMEMIHGSLSGSPIQIALPDWSNYQYTYALTNNTSTQVNMAIPAKYSSLKSIFVTVRQNTGAQGFFPFSSTAQGLTSYFFRIGSQILPSKNPDNYAEMFAEVVKALGSMSDILYTPTISFATYFNSASAHLDTQITTVANMATTNSGNFCIGIDLENYVNAPKSTIFAGYNSNTDDIFVVMNHTGVQTGTVRYDAYACFDSVLVFENNTCYRKF